MPLSDDARVQWAWCSYGYPVCEVASFTEEERAELLEMCDCDGKKCDDYVPRLKAFRKGMLATRKATEE